MAAQQSVSFGSEPLKVSLFQKTSSQKFARNDVLIHQSIDPYQRIIEAGKILASGESLFMHDHILNKK